MKCLSSAGNQEVVMMEKNFHWLHPGKPELPSLEHGERTGGVPPPLRELGRHDGEGGRGQKGRGTLRSRRVGGHREDADYGSGTQGHGKCNYDHARGITGADGVAQALRHPGFHLPGEFLWPV